MSGESFYPLGGGFDPAPLLARLTEDMWNADTRRQDYPGTVHKDTRCIFVRWADMQDDETVGEAVFYNLNTIDLPMCETLMPEIGEACMSLLERLGDVNKLGRVMLTELPAGAGIPTHIDEGVYGNLYDRFHLCLQGDEGSVYECGGKTLSPLPGDMFWTNHKRPHSVRNDGEVTRIHLILDAQAFWFTRMRGITYQGERLLDCWEEAQDLLFAHWEEIAHYQDIPLAPDQEAYLTAEALGQFRLYTVRDVTKLIGYAVFFVKHNIHYSGSLQAVQDILFLKQEYRKSMVGVRLIQYAERRLRAEGVQAVYHHVKRTNKVGRLLERMGYELVDEVYAKRLDSGVQ